MADVLSSQFPMSQSPIADALEVSSGEAEMCISESEQNDKSSDNANCNTSEGPNGEQEIHIRNHGACVANQANEKPNASGDDRLMCILMEDENAYDTEVSCSNQQDICRPGVEDDGDLIRHKREFMSSEKGDKAKTDQVPQGGVEVFCTNAEMMERIHSSQSDEDLSVAKDIEVEAPDLDEEEDEPVKEDEEKFIKLRKSRLECRECGKRFNRRETFNLHRHFHVHEEDLASLTCKECGLIFQHRSSLIKHRSEHRDEEERAIALKKEMHTREESSPDWSPERSFGDNIKCTQCKKAFMTVAKLRRHNCSNCPEKPYHCPLCRQEFQFKLSITKHMQSHSLESVFTCQVCNKSFSDGVSLRCHQRCHGALKPFECPECGMVFKHYSVMEDHRRRHSENAGSLGCHICGKRFKYGSLLHQHQYLHTGQKPFQCPECGKSFAFAQNMKAHCRQHRLQRTIPLISSDQFSTQAHVSTFETIQGSGKENANRSIEPIRTFKCPLCPEMYNAPADLRAHMLIHEKEYDRLENRAVYGENEVNKDWEIGHTCSHCPCTFRDEASCKRHMLSHKSSSCSEEIVRKEPEVRRISQPKIENVPGRWRVDGPNNKPYKCPECLKMFRHRSVLELHMRIHSKDKPYKCKVCNKSFRFSSYLQQHMIIHTGEKPYKCPDCGKDFAFLQNMKTHLKLHLQKPFRCTSCRKGYSDEVQLQRHMLSHKGEKPHKCDLCDKSFGLAYLLRDHMNTHTGDRPHRCQECHKSFPWFSSLLVHQKIHARKGQAPGQSNYFPVGVRTRGRGSRGRGGRIAWGCPRPISVSNVVLSQPLYQSPLLQGAEWQSTTVHPQPPMFSTQIDLQDRQQQNQWLSEGRAPPVRWRVDGGHVRPVPLSPPPQQFNLTSQQSMQMQSDSPIIGTLQQEESSLGWSDIPFIAQTRPNIIQNLESSQESAAKDLVGDTIPSAVPKNPSPTLVNEFEKQRKHHLKVWDSSVSVTSLPSSSSSQLEFPVSPTFLESSELCNLKKTSTVPTAQSSINQLEKEPNLLKWSSALVSVQKELNEHLTPPKRDEKVWDFIAPQFIQKTVNPSEITHSGAEKPKHWTLGFGTTSTSVQINPCTTISNSNPKSFGERGISWDFRTPPVFTNTSNFQDKSSAAQQIELQQKHLSSGWNNVQLSRPNIPISIQYEPRRFPHGIGTNRWGFQSNHVGPQTLVSGPIKPGNVPELQHQPVVSGTQIILNQASPFFSSPLSQLSHIAVPGHHPPLHSVSVGSYLRPPHPNLFFPPQAVRNDRPMIPALSLPQLGSRTETHTLAGHLPFAPDRLLQCMICGCSLPRELDLQIHYLKHAQGDI